MITVPLATLSPSNHEVGTLDLENNNDFFPSSMQYPKGFLGSELFHSILDQIIILSPDN